MKVALVVKFTGNSVETPKKKPRGRPFQKGQSGNPSGRPKTPEEVQALFKERTEWAAYRLFELAKSAEEPIALKATIEILNRALGKAPESVKVTTDSAGPFVSMGAGEILAIVASLKNQADGDAAQ